MYKLYLPMALLMSLVLGSGLAAFTSNSASAQNYGNDDSYSKYPTEDKNYECRTGPFEGFFVSSVEFCKFNKFDKDDRKDIRDNRTGTQGPAGPQGIQGIQGPIGPNGTQGDIGPAGLSVINDTNIYRNVSSVDLVGGSSNSTTATCDPGDTPLSGGHSTFDTNPATHNFDLMNSDFHLMERDGK